MKGDEADPLELRDEKAWSAWLARHHAASNGVWLALFKKGSARKLITHAQALEVAIAWGWIDAQTKKGPPELTLRRFTPRRPRSLWSKINCAKATALIESGVMKPPGLAEVERAKADGRWAAAYDGSRTAEVPPDLAEALSKNAKASKRFATLDARNRYAVLHRVQIAKKPETRARRIALFVAMLAKGETLY